MKRYYFSLFFLLLVAVIAWLLLSSVPQQQGEIILSGLQKQVTIEYDQFANPSISAESKTDAFYALGYLTASERLFQMDLMRRKAAGKLAEVFGNKALQLDIKHRHQAFQKTAIDIVATLPEEQLKILHAYTAGVNAYLQQATILPPEFLALSYQPEPWQASDSILVSLNIFNLLNKNATDERMLTVMQQVIPAEVIKFLTPKNDIYNAQAFLSGEDPFVADKQSIPVNALRQINQQNRHRAAINLVQSNALSLGSNQWASNNTKDGRAIIANDMHLPLAMPNLWYQARLNYEGISLSGISLPGLPLIIAGSNQNIAWGFTNAKADVLDLVTLSINPDNAEQYQTQSGWQNFKVHTEVIRVKGQQDTNLKVRQTQWGPVSPRLLLGKQVAMQWTVYRPKAADLKLAQIDRVKTIDAAIKLFNQAGFPPLNVILADNQGHIAWTLTGKFPRRTHFDGSTSVIREQESTTWDGMMPSHLYPRIIDPPTGILMTANNRVIAQQTNFPIGHNFAQGFRAYRISELLMSQQTVDEDSLHKIQLDTQSDFYRFYQQLALSTLTDNVTATDPFMQELKAALQNWDGHANAESIGFGLLVEYRQALANYIFSSYLQQCKTLDNNFKYHWLKMDTPLRLLLTHKIPDTLPVSERFSSWSDLILQTLTNTANNIQQRFPEKHLSQLSWGEMHKVHLQHPFSHVFPRLGFAIDTPEQPLAGCIYCIRVATTNFGASMRLVVSPGHEDNMILVTPTGQSGHPLSAHYQDKFPYWVNGKKTPRHRNFEDSMMVLKPNGYGS